MCKPCQEKEKRIKQQQSSQETKTVMVDNEIVKIASNKFQPPKTLPGLK